MAGPWLPWLLGVVGWLGSSAIITLALARWLKTQAAHDASCGHAAPLPWTAR